MVLHRVMNKSLLLNSCKILCNKQFRVGGVNIHAKIKRKVNRVNYTFNYYNDNFIDNNISYYYEFIHIFVINEFYNWSYIFNNLYQKTI